MKPGAVLVGMLNPFDRDGLQKLADAQAHRVRARSRAAHHARAEHGRAVLAGQHRRLQGGDDRGRQVPALHADADDRGRHGQSRARADAGRGRGRPAGDRHGQAPGRRDRSVRRAARPSRSRSSRWAPSSSTCPTRPTRNGSRRGRRRLRAADAAGVARAAEGARSHERVAAGRHRHHHRADPGPRRAGAGHRGNGASR